MFAITSLCLCEGISALVSVCVASPPVPKGYVLTANGDNTADFKPLPQGAAVADVTAAPTKEQFNALLAALRTAGVIANK